MAQKPLYSPAEEQAIMTKLWSPEIADDPEAFVMLVYPWGKKGTPLEKFTGPRKWQRKMLRRIRDHNAMNRINVIPKMLRSARCSGRGIGKTALESWLAHWMISCHIGATVRASANSEAQLRTILWGELSRWVTMSLNAHWWDLSATKITPAGWLSELVERDLKKGTRQWGAEGVLWSEENPSSYAGPHNMDGMMVIFDEASSIPDSIWSVAAGFFTEPVPNRYWFAFSNGRRNQGYFYETFNGKRDFWDNENIDARTVEGTDQSVYQDIIDEYGEDSDEARIEVYGEFPADGDDLFISPRVVDLAMKRPAHKDPSAPVIIGVDPARSGSDSTAIVVRRGRDVEVERYKGADTMEIVGHIIDAIQKHDPDLVCIDEGGVGAGVVDRLKEQRYKQVRGVMFGWKPKNPKAYLNKRAEMWGDMKEWLKGAALPNDKRLKTDLTAPRKEPDSSGVLQLESKKKMKARGAASPDSGDALALTFAFPVAKRRTPKTEPRRPYQPGSTSTNWMSN